MKRGGGRGSIIEPHKRTVGVDCEISGVITCPNCGVNISPVARCRFMFCIGIKYRRRDANIAICKNRDEPGLIPKNVARRDERRRCRLLYASIPNIVSDWNFAFRLESITRLDQ